MNVLSLARNRLSQGYEKVTQNTEIFSTKYGKNILEVGSPASVYTGVQCCPKSKIVGSPTDHPWWMAGLSVLPLGGP